MPAEISVVIPTFRRPLLLQQAIESALAQHVPVEVIVVDDSPERSADPVVKNFGSMVHYFANPSPSGGWPSRVRNLGWPHATAPLIHFLDDDDQVPAGHYLKIIDTFASHPEVGVVFGVIAPFADDDGEQLEHELSFFDSSARRARAASRWGTKLGFSMQMFFCPTLLVCSAAIVRTEVVRTLGGFDPKAHVSEDVEFYARAIRRSGAKFLNRKALHYRIDPTSLMRSTSADEVRQTYQLMYEKYRRDYGSRQLLALKVLARTLGRLG